MAAPDVKAPVQMETAPAEKAPAQMEVAIAVPAAALAPPSQDAMDLYASNLQRACSLLLVLSIVRMFYGSLEGMLGFFAACSVLCFSAPGALGVARSCGFRVRFCSLAAGILAGFSLIAILAAFAANVPAAIGQDMGEQCAAHKLDNILGAMDALKLDHAHMHPPAKSHGHLGLPPPGETDEFDAESGERPVVPEWTNHVLFLPTQDGGAARGAARRMLAAVAETAHEALTAKPGEGVDQRCSCVGRAVAHIVASLMVLGAMVELGIFVSALSAAKHARLLLLGMAQADAAAALAEAGVVAQAAPVSA